MHFTFSVKYLENDCEDVPIGKNNVEEIKTGVKSKDSSVAIVESEDNPHKKISNRETFLPDRTSTRQIFLQSCELSFQTQRS